ncbi:MAG: FAD-dependent oxidoreductase, partial [Ardenticatenaceae bacterium]
LVPELERYFEHVPQPLLHYGGYYTKTRENLPLIGPLEVKGAYVVSAFAGFGTMTSCAAGELIATWVAGDTLPDYAPAFSPARYDDAAYVASLDEMDVNGEL